jgi:O-antigen ligase
MFDPNDIAFIEVSLMSLALAVVVGGYRIVLKALALAALLMSVLLALYSASRGGAIALAAWLLLFLGLPIVKISGLRKVAVIGVAAVLVSANADKINIERLSTLMNLQDDYNMSAEGGRTDIWKRGLGELRQRPLTGVGVACFGEAVGLARERDGELGRRQTAHNSYVQVATETGVIGGLLFLLLIGTCLFNFNRLRKKRNNTIPELAGHSALFLVGFVALSTAAFFLSQGYSVFFILYFALSGCLRIIVRDTACGGDEGATDRAAQTALGSS